MEKLFNIYVYIYVFIYFKKYIFNVSFNAKNFFPSEETDLIQATTFLSALIGLNFLKLLLMRGTLTGGFAKLKGIRFGRRVSLLLTVTNVVLVLPMLGAAAGLANSSALSPPS